MEESKLTFEELWLEEEEYDWETFSYLITSLLEDFPSEWEEIEIPLKINEKQSKRERLITNGNIIRDFFLSVLKK